MALTITEDWIRERVKLKHNNLEDVRSLSLPGTYHEKISTLGDSLRNFTRLKALDLSRNAIESLQGLESLKMLEKLTLYYNNVPSLQELYRLRYNQRLQELDLRLNAVARNEPDYRLFLIHMLPNLRRLDDRAVRDSERKAALMHYTSDQAAEFTEHAPRPLTPPQPANPRAEQVRALARPPNVVENDDAILLDYASKTKEELRDPRPITGSVATRPLMEEYPAEVARQMDRGAVVLLPPPTQSQPTGPSSTLPKPILVATTSTATNSAPPQSVSMATNPGSASSQLDDLLKRYPNLVAPPPSRNMENNGAKKNGTRLAEDPNLKFQDEIEAYTAYKGQGHFTPHPGEGEVPPVLPSGVEGTTQDQLEEGLSASVQRTVELYRAHDTGASRPDLAPPTKPGRDTTEAAQPGPKPASQQAPPPTDDRYNQDVPLTGEYGVFVSRISELVDKYWNGAKSLVKNARFKHHMNALYQDLSSGSPQGGRLVSTEHPKGSEVARLQRELSEAREENTRLRERALVSLEAEGAEGSKETRGGTLIRAQRDVSLLRGRLQKSIEENKHLQERIASLESGQGPTGSSGNGVTTGDIETIGNENERLRGEIKSLGIRLKQAGQMQELAAMLQQSHKSLVETNEHLLRELNDARRANEGRPSSRRDYTVAPSGPPPPATQRNNTEAGMYVAPQGQIMDLYPPQTGY